MLKQGSLEPGGMMMGLGVRPMARMKYIYTNAHSMGKKEEELEAIVRLESYDTVAIMELECCHGWLLTFQKR